MHSFAMMKAPTRQVGPPPQASQAATNLSPVASGAWSANTTQQYMTGNTGVQLSQSANFASQNGANPSRRMANWQSSDTSYHPAQPKKTSHFKDHYFLNMLLSQSQYTLNNLKNENVPVPTTCVSQSAPRQNSHQYLATQSQHGTVTNTTYAQQNMSVFCKRPNSFHEEQTNRTMGISNIQQSRALQAMHPAVNKDMTRTISSYNPAPSLPYEQMVNANTAPSAAVHNSPTQVAPNQIHRQSLSQGGYSQNHPPSYEMATSQPFRNNDVAAKCTSATAQAIYACTTGQLNQQASAQCNPSYYNCGGFRSINSWNQYENNSFQMKTNDHPLSHDAAHQQMLRQNVLADSISKSNTGCSDGPSYYKSYHYVNMSRVSNQNVQTTTCSLTASQPLPLYSGQPLPQSVMSRAQHTINAPFQQNSSPNSLSVTTAGNQVGRGQVVPVNETASKRYPVESTSNVAQGCKTVLLESNEPHAFAVSHSNNNGMPLPFKQNDICASMSSHSSIRAVAVVPPLSQEECHSPASAEPCKSVDDAEKSCVSPSEAMISETTCVREESNCNRVSPNKAACGDGAVLTISDSEPESLAQTSKWDNHESVVHTLSDVSAGQTGSGKQTEGIAPYSPPVHELSLIPTKSWTTEALTKLILETDKAQPKSKDTPKHSTLVKILITLWNKNIVSFIQNYKDSFQLDKLSDVENFCDTHIKRDTVVLTQVSPDFKDQLKRYNVLKDGEVYSEPPYKSLWLNVNEQLDDIDKEFGFPWTLKRHLYVDETESQGQDVQTSVNIPEQAVNETINKALSPAESDSVEMIEKSDFPQNPPTSPVESSGKSSFESSYSFKIEVLPPEEAKVIFEHIQQKKQQTPNGLKETAVSGSEQREQSEHIGPTINEPKVKESLDNQLKEICCLARFVEMNLGLGKPPSQCQCRDKQNANKGTFKMLKPDPDHLPISQDVDCQTAQSALELPNNFCQIIDLTDDDDNQLLSFFDEEPEPIFQISTCSQSDSDDGSGHKVVDLCDDLSSPKETHDLVLKKGESEGEHVQEELLSAGAVQSSDSVRYTQPTSFDPSNNIETKEPFPLSNQEVNCNQAPVTSPNKNKSPSENKTQTQVTNASNQTSLSLHVNNGRSVKKEKRQRSLDHFFPSLKKPKKSSLPVASDPEHTSEVQRSASEAKTAELVLFGAGQQVAGSEKRFLVSSQTSPSYEKHRPPGVLSVKLDSLGRYTPTADAPKNYSVKQLIYDKWRRSVPAVAFHQKNKLRRRTSLHASVSSGSIQEKQTVSPELKLSDRTKKYILSTWKRRALTERRRHEKIKKSYSVTLPDHQQGSETQNETGDGMPSEGGIVLKFSLLPNTFNFTDGSTAMKKAAEPVSDKLEPVEEKAQFPKTAVTKLKGTWYPSRATDYEPLCVSKNVSLFQEYQKKYKEKTHVDG